MIKLAETYFRLAIHLSPSDRETFDSFLVEAARQNSKNLFRQKPEIEVHLEEGSLRGWITAAGIFTAICNYGSFRDGVEYLVKDARTFSELMLSSVKGTGIERSVVLRTERRTAVPGKIKRILGELEELKEHGRDMSKAEYKRKIEKINRKIERAFSQIEGEEDRSLILKNLPRDIRSKLPAHLPRPFDPRIALKPDELLYLPSPVKFLTDKDHTIFPHQEGLQTELKRHKDQLYRVDYSSNGLRLIKEDQGLGRAAWTGGKR